MDAVLATPPGRLTSKPYNIVVSVFIAAIQKCTGLVSSAALQQRNVRRQRIELLYSARHLRYTSGFRISLQAVFYAIS